MAIDRADTVFVAKWALVASPKDVQLLAETVLEYLESDILVVTNYVNMELAHQAVSTLAVELSFVREPL